MIPWTPPSSSLGNSLLERKRKRDEEREGGKESEGKRAHARERASLSLLGLDHHHALHQRAGSHSAGGEFEVLQPPLVGIRNSYHQRRSFHLREGEGRLKGIYVLVWELPCEVLAGCLCGEREQSRGGARACERERATESSRKRARETRG